MAATPEPHPDQAPGARIGVVVVAAGSSSRMGGVDKTFVPVLGAPLIAYALDVFEAFAPVAEIALVLDEASLERGDDLVRRRGYRKVSRICAGGPRRQDSVRNGLESLTPCDWVIIHDGARPCLDRRMLRRGLEAARKSGASAAGMPVKDTIKVVSPRSLVVDTPPRARLWAAQTPQVFCYDLLWEAHARCAVTVTDDAALVERLGHPVRMFRGSYENLKVTTPEDLAVVEAFLRFRAGVPI
jgi:2-C-methyl-D-erythritol 4-phosphate cytidylyltransferase